MLYDVCATVLPYGNLFGWMFSSSSPVLHLPFCSCCSCCWCCRCCCRGGRIPYSGKVLVVFDLSSNANFVTPYSGCRAFAFGRILRYILSIQNPCASFFKPFSPDCAARRVLSALTCQPRRVDVFSWSDRAMLHVAPTGPRRSKPVKCQRQRWGCCTMLQQATIWLNQVKATSLQPSQMRIAPR